MKIKKQDESITEVYVTDNTAELIRSSKEIGKPALLVIHAEQPLKDTDDPEAAAYFRNAPYLTALARGEGYEQTESSQPFDFEIAETELEVYLTDLYKDRTPLQIREITRCFTKARSGITEEIMAAESAGFYRLMAEKNAEPQKEAPPESGVPENAPESFTLTETDGILTLTMNAAGNNLMTASFFRYYEEIMEQIERRSSAGSCKGLIITGSGRHFSVGADVAALAQRSSEEECDPDTGVFPQQHLRQKHYFTFMHELPFPVVSAISGFCIGSGSEIAVSSHYRVCEKTLRAGQPESTFGILPALGGIARTIGICGIKEAYRLIMTGELINAEKAHQLNWADIVTEKKQSAGEAAALIEYISRNYSSFDPLRRGEYLNAYLEKRRESK